MFCHTLPLFYIDSLLYYVGWLVSERKYEYMLTYGVLESSTRLTS
jgi:hypothetical protein